MTAFNYEYSKQRKRGVKPALAKEWALIKSAANKARNIKNGYNSDYFFIGGYNKPVIYGKTYVYNSRIGNTQTRWIENTEIAGLRETSLNCEGWYCNEYADTIAQGVVYQLPARNGKPVFISGVKDQDNEGAALVDFTTWIDDENGAINNSNRMAQDYAEKERIHQEESRREMEMDELREEISEDLKRGITLIQDAKKIRAALCETVELKNMLSQSLVELRENIARKRRKIEELS